MKNKQAKRLMLNTCTMVADNGDVSWMNRISIRGSNLMEGDTLIYCEHLGVFDDAAHALAQKTYQLNFPLKECKQVF